jgi:hypothetical protein
VAEGARLESVFTRKGNVGSNPTLSATQSEVQKNPPGFLWKLREMGAILQILARKPDWRKCASQYQRRGLQPFSPEGMRAVRFQ